MRELTLPAPLVLLPGLGADARLFDPQREAFGDAVWTPEWIPADSPRESLGHYARRWAQTVNQHVAEFDEATPWFLGGASMGGMLALEMVPHLRRRPAAVLMIASAQSTPDYPWYLDLSASLVGKLSPRHAGTLLRFGALPMGIRDGQDDSAYRKLMTMAKDADPDRLAWAMGAAAEWTYPGPPAEIDGQPFPPVHHIHGRRDWMIPLDESVAPEVVEQGRHVLTLSHPRTVNRWIFERLTQHCGIDESHEPRVQDPDAAVRRRPDLAARF